MRAGALARVLGCCMVDTRGIGEYRGMHSASRVVVAHDMHSCGGDLCFLQCQVSRVVGWQFIAKNAYYSERATLADQIFDATRCNRAFSRPFVRGWRRACCALWVAAFPASEQYCHSNVLLLWSIASAVCLRISAGEDPPL